MSNLAMCALRRAGKPQTAADLTDRMMAVVDSDGLPRQFAMITPKHVAKMLERLEAAGHVRRCGTTTDRGNERPLWEPVVGYSLDASPGWDFPIAQSAPRPSRSSGHILDGKSPEQARALFDVDQDIIAAQSRHAQAVAALVATQSEEMGRLIARSRARLDAVGLGARE